MAGDTGVEITVEAKLQAEVASRDKWDKRNRGHGKRQREEEWKVESELQAETQKA
jgi:hypothetical protein